VTHGLLLILLFQIHPGGELLLLEFAGKDGTADFFGLHRQDVLEKYS